jgi:plasmid stabilization system protein ParE
MPRYEIGFALKASAQVDRLARWWRKNRPRNPSLLEAEMAAVLSMLAELPEAGQAWALARGIRRVLMPRTQHYVYYRIVPKAMIVRVVAVRHAAREKGPPL